MRKDEPPEHDTHPDVAADMFFDRHERALGPSTYQRLFAHPAYRFLARDHLGCPAGEVEVVTAWLGIDQRPLPDAREPTSTFGTAVILTDRNDALVEDPEWWAGSRRNSPTKPCRRPRPIPCQT